jgi:hypothetical protein
VSLSISIVPLWARLLAAGIALALLIWLGFTVAGWRQDAAEAKAALAQANAQAKATSAIAADAGQAQQERQALDITIHQSRAESERAFEELRRANPSIAAYADEPIPDGLRELARARRESRERSRGAEAGRPNAE